jgi:hypothetical protein
MKLKFKLFEDWTIVFFIIIILVSTISGIKYFDSQEVFDAKILQQNQLGEFSIDLQIENKINTQLDFEIETIYKRGNIVIDTQSVRCNSICDSTIVIDKIFFDKYDIIIKTFYEGRGYQKKLSFIFDKEKSTFSAKTNSKIFWSSGDLKIPIRLNSSNSQEITKYVLDIFPTSRPEIRSSFIYECNDICNDDFIISRSILFGEYTVNIYSPSDVLKLNFDVISLDLQNSSENLIVDTDSLTEINITKFPISNNQTKNHNSGNQSNLKQSLEKLNIKENIVNTSSAKLVRNYAQILFEIESNLDKNITDLIGDSNKNSNTKIIAIDLGGNQIELNNISEVLENKKFTAIISQINTNTLRPEQIKLKPIIQNVNELIEIENLTLREISITEKLQQKDQTALIFKPTSFVTNSNQLVSKQIIGKEEKISEQTENGFEKTDLTLEKLQNKDSHKLVPGIYKKEERTLFADGSEETKEEYFAYGLITVNTIKPLYKKNELVEMKIVVLDKGGFLVSNAKIDLEITKPSGQSQILSTLDNQIIESEKQGVYITEIYANELGNYNLYAQVEQSDMIVDVQTYFNVVEDNKILFQIIRDVPATIDPWLGPFNNTFSITPNSYSGKYNFTEVFSSDFKNISTNADIIETTNDLTYLTWNDLINTNTNLFYSAQVPLVTPYLYELGKSFVDFGTETFYEDRPWLFAIDPVAKVCDFRGGPGDCYCGASCAGGIAESAANDGTIDSCVDTNVNYEWVNELTIENADGSSYFGTGNSVTACISVRVDTNERINMFYMDHSANSGTNFGTTTPAAGVTTVYESYNLHTDDGDHTYCQTFTLNNYVGTHYLRGKQVYQGTSGRACEGSGGYKDQDDISFEVLEKRGPIRTSWDLDNGTNIGTNLNVIRGNSISLISNWDLPLQAGGVRHNGAGSNIWYSVDTYSDNQTNYILNTSNITLASNLGLIRFSQVNASDFYFDISTLNTSGNKQFYLYGTTSIVNSILTPYVSNAGTLSNFSCRVQDELVGIDYSNVNVSFKVDGSLIGTSLTNSTGWAKVSYTPGTIGEFNLSCEVVDELGKYYLASDTNYIDFKILDVKPPGADINPPEISNISVSSPLIIPAGNQFDTHADFSDDLSLKEIFMSIKIPSGSTNLISYSVYDNLVAYWDFDKINSSHIQDFGPNNISGILLSGASFNSVSGIRNNYGTFDGINDRIELNKYSQVNGASELSVAGWIKVTDLNDDNSFITKDTWGASASLLFWADESGSHAGRTDMLAVLLSGNSKTVRAETATDSLNDSNWHHVAFTFKGNDVNGVRVYIDGIEDIFSPVSTIGLSNLKSTTNELILGNSVGGISPLGGNLEDIFIFNRSLESWEIQNLFNHNSILNLSYDFGYTGTSEFGNYEYFYGAYDISDNYGFSAKYNFETKGIDGYLDTKIDKSNYKIGQSISFQTPSFVTDSNSTLVNELGDTGNIFYDFTTDLQGWTSGTLNAGTNNWVRGNEASPDCPNQPCIATTLNGNVGTNTDQYIESPSLSFLGRSNVKMSYFFALDSDTGSADRAYIEGYDGFDWDYVIFQDSISGGGSWGPTSTLNSASDLNGVDDSKIRFRLTSDGSSNYEGWRVDDINITFTPRVEWSNEWITYDSSFGIDEQVSAIEFSVNITSYANDGSMSNGNNNPDLEFEFYNGTGYSNTQTCGLNSGLSYPSECKFIMGSEDEFLSSWNISSNRNIRIRTINMDNSDLISFKDVRRTYARPSLVKNYGILPIDAYLVHNLINSSGDIVQKLLKQSVSISVDSYIDLSLINVTLNPSLELGNYVLQTAIEDNLGSVFVSESDSSDIENNINITLGGLKININSPINNTEYFQSALLNVTPDVSLISSGGWCGYSLNGNTTQDLIMSGTSFTKELTQDGDYSLIFFCNDTDGDIVPSESINFKIFTVFERDTSIFKNVKSISENMFLVNVTIENLETSVLEKTLSEYIPSNFIETNFSVPYNYTSSITGPLTGKILTWEFQLNSSEIKSFTYYLAGVGDFNKNYLLKTSLD